MNEEKPTASAPAPFGRPRRRAVPLLTSVVIVVLAIACAAEGYLIYLKQLQIVSGSMDSDLIRGELTQLQTNLDQANSTLQEYTSLLGYYSVGDLREAVKDAPTGTARSLVDNMNTELQLALAKIARLEASIAERDNTIQGMQTVEGQLRSEIAVEKQRAERSELLLGNEQQAHSNDVQRLEAESADWKKKFERSDADYADAARSQREELQKRLDLAAHSRAREEVLRVLLAQRLRVPVPGGLSAAVLAPYQLRLQVASATRDPVNRVVLPFHPDLEEGMHFNIYGPDSQQAKCRIEVQIVHEDRAHAEVIAVYGRYEPVRAGDLADLDLAYEEIRRADGLPVTP